MLLMEMAGRACLWPNNWSVTIVVGIKKADLSIRFPKKINYSLSRFSLCLVGHRLRLRHRRLRHGYHGLQNPNFFEEVLVGYARCVEVAFEAAVFPFFVVAFVEPVADAQHVVVAVVAAFVAHGHAPFYPSFAAFDHGQHVEAGRFRFHGFYRKHSVFATHCCFRQLGLRLHGYLGLVVH